MTVKTEFRVVHDTHKSLTYDGPSNLPVVYQNELGKAEYIYSRKGGKVKGEGHRFRGNVGSRVT